MKKFFGGLLGILAFVAMAAALTVPAIAAMISANEAGKMGWAAALFNSDWLLFGVCIGVCAFVLLIGAIINARCGKAAYWLSGIFGIGVFGALLYLINWGPLVPEGAILPMLELNLTNANLLYVAAGVMGAGLILSFFGRLLRRKARKEKLAARRAQKMQAHESYVPTSRDTDLAIASSRTPKIERYVRDPWGNLIREEDYNQRINAAKNKKF